MINITLEAKKHLETLIRELESYLIIYELTGD